MIGMSLRSLRLPVKFRISVVQVGKSLKITVPKELCDHLGLKKGDKVEVWTDDNELVVRKV
jgi:AbrB family looped-hinge helix DNA binding protein